MPTLSDLPQLLRDHNWPQAERVLRSAAKKRNAPAEVFYNLAKVLEASGKVGQMQSWLERAVRAKPDYAIAWFELGRRALVQLDILLAFNAFQRAAVLDPTDADARRNLGRTALRLGRWETASDCFVGDEDAEAQMARYRIAAETGQDITKIQMDLLSQTDLRTDVLKTLTRTAKGSVPLRLP